MLWRRVSWIGGHRVYMAGNFEHGYFMYLYRNVNDSMGGELVLGGTDSTHFVGNLGYIPVTKTTYWQVKLDR